MDIYTALKNDHEELKGLLSELLELDKDDDYRNVVIDQVKNHLVPHSRAEESVFYNAIRAVGSDNSNVMHSYKEHMEAEALLRGLQVKDITNSDWKTTAQNLKTALEHHIAEEEGKVFSEAKTMFSEEEAEMMGKAFLQLKEKVAKEGFLKNSFDMVVNLMPPRFVDQIRNLGGANLE